MSRHRRHRALKPSNRASRTRRPSKILVIDIGGSNVKLLVSGESEPRKFPSGDGLDPASLVQQTVKVSAGWRYDAVSIGYPGLVGAHGPQSEPGHLGAGWVGFDFAAAFNRPVRIINDAAMQALGSYDGGRMLFIGLGTGVGSALIAENVIVPLELGTFPLRRKLRLSAQIGAEGLRALGKRLWRRRVGQAINALVAAFNVVYVVVGGGNAKRLGKTLPPNTRLGNNLSAFRGGFRLWNLADVPTLHTHDAKHAQPQLAPAKWRVI
jgi:polyphosphate glucokinase